MKNYEVYLFFWKCFYINRRELIRQWKKRSDSDNNDIVPWKLKKTHHLNFVTFSPLKNSVTKLRNVTKLGVTKLSGTVSSAVSKLAVDRSFRWTPILGRRGWWTFGRRWRRTRRSVCGARGTGGRTSPEERSLSAPHTRSGPSKKSAWKPRH